MTIEKKIFFSRVLGFEPRKVRLKLTILPIKLYSYFFTENMGFEPMFEIIKN